MSQWKISRSDRLPVETAEKAIIKDIKTTDDQVKLEIMSEQRLVDTPHLNNGLFADYYLNEIIPTLPEWSDGELFAEAKAVFQRLPIPELTTEHESSLAAIAEEITGLARSRYALHEDMRRTIISEFDGEAINTRVALYRW